MATTPSQRPIWETRPTKAAPRLSRKESIKIRTAMANITLKVNGKTHTVDVAPSTPLLYVLRNDLDLHGPRFGCGLGQCGACAVIINGVATRSCVTPTSNVKGEVTTL